MAAAMSNRAVQVGIYAVVALLLLAAIFQASGPASSIARQHAPWAYRPKGTYEEHTADKHSQYDNDVYDDELDSNSTAAKSPGPSSALADEEDVNGHISGPVSNAENGYGKWAFATFLSTATEDKRDDPYFTACRTLAYQLLQHPKTKTQRNIPLLVLTPPHAHDRKLDMLTDEGAKVIKVDPMDVGEDDWTDKNSGMKASAHFARLRMWEMKQYSRILYIDAATLLMRPIDDIFDEALVKGDMRALTKIEASNGFEELGVDRPKEYFMASVADAKNSKHAFPPPDENWMSPGFYMLKPDGKVYKYLESMLKTPDQFDRKRLMAGLLNKAHRRDGPMPWSTFEPGKWNVNYPGKQDLEGGVATLHTKFWDGNNRDWLARELVEMWWRIQGQMEGFWFRRGYGAPKVFD